MSVHPLKTELLEAIRLPRPNTHSVLHLLGEVASHGALSLGVHWLSEVGLGVDALWLCRSYKKYSESTVKLIINWNYETCTQNCSITERG